ncbi:MAG: riboflavin synthase [Cellulomonadaceae bacterium]|jgi:riboflavin synthase|nr:riboflavin synthase [Cellulomonadaceae bacterium]
MFTGIVEEMGCVRLLAYDGQPGSETLDSSADDAPQTSRQDAFLVIETSFAHEVKLGESVAVNGVCLTVVEIDDRALAFDVMPQTLRLTALGDLRAGAPVNLERALPAAGRLDGHIVQGHVDGVATLLNRQPGERWDILRFTLPAHLAKYVAPQGSIAVSGTSLTITEVFDASQASGTLSDGVLPGGILPDDGTTAGETAADEPAHEFAVSLIPATLAATTLGTLDIGERVNIEVDVLAKYVERMLTVDRTQEAPA